MKKILVFIFMLGILSSCQKEDAFIEEGHSTSNNTDKLQTEFAKILASAVSDSYELRNLLKKEALKQFDKDYDVFYQLIKDETLGEGTVSEFLASYAKSSEQFNEIEESMPLLTIYVPVLPNFNAESWNARNEIPQVAVINNDGCEVPYFDESGRKSLVPDGMIPGFPILIVKQNERVTTGEPSGTKSTGFSKGKYSFNFIDASFNGIDPKANEKRITPSSGIDPVNIEAYNLGMQWHRDYVYYGLTPTNTTGSYRHNYSECITSFTMLSDSWLGKISDQESDPHVIPIKFKQSSPSWTDGFFEFKVEVLINATNGAGTTLIKYFPAKGSDLADITYKKSGFFYIVDEITRKTYNPNIELVPWDLKNYGMAWKFKISEVDPSEEYTYTEEISSTFATNFGIEGTIKKIGLKFGASATTSHKSSCTRKISYNSDDLGETILTFDQPVITGSGSIFGIKFYFTREISTGWCSLSVEPKKIF